MVKFSAPGTKVVKLVLNLSPLVSIVYTCVTHTAVYVTPSEHTNPVFKSVRDCRLPQRRLGTWYRRYYIVLNLVGEGARSKRPKASSDERAPSPTNLLNII